jgi:squalene-hopene/tetraprenyl-beta-curcumene cyclase
VKHDWYRELAEILIKNQHRDGYWVNTEERWLETNKILVTCYSILALDEGYEGYR